MPRQHARLILLVVVLFPLLTLACTPRRAASPDSEQLAQNIFQHDGRTGRNDTQRFSLEEGQRYRAVWTPARCVGNKAIVGADSQGSFELQHEQPPDDDVVVAMLPPLPSGRYSMAIEGRCSFTMRVSRLVN